MTVYSLRHQRVGFGMTSAAQASAGRVSANTNDHASHRRREALDPASQQKRIDVVEDGSHTQARPPREASKAGLQRIVDAMRAALRHRQTIHITRKDIARFAGVTPALITYYFPERDVLTEAVTIPVVTAMVDAVQSSLSGGEDPRKRLLRAIDVLVASYAVDATLIELFSVYRASKADALPDLIGRMEAAMVTFFNCWLQQHPDAMLDAVSLQKVAIGMCKIVARCNQTESPREHPHENPRMTPAEAICALLLQPTANG